MHSSTCKKLVRDNKIDQIVSYFSCNITKQNFTIASEWNSMLGIGNVHTRYFYLRNLLYLFICIYCGYSVVLVPVLIPILLIYFIRLFDKFCLSSDNLALILFWWNKDTFQLFFFKISRFYLSIIIGGINFHDLEVPFEDLSFPLLFISV